jgi:hypothetical protein
MFDGLEFQATDEGIPLCWSQGIDFDLLSCSSKLSHVLIA